MMGAYENAQEAIEKIQEWKEKNIRKPRIFDNIEQYEVGCQIAAIEEIMTFIYENPRFDVYDAIRQYIWDTKKIGFSTTRKDIQRIVDIKVGTAEALQEIF